MAAREALMEEKVLELGCGRNKRKGAFGVDILADSDADVVHDLDVFPYPFGDSEWDRILCFDVLEHVQHFVRGVEEIWRIARPGATVEVTGPFMSSVNYFSDPTHRRAFTSRTFDYFIEGTPWFRYGYSRARFRLKACDFDRDQRPLRRGIHRLLLDWVNGHKKVYEERLAFIYPVHTVYFELEVLK
jgi:SAM-dependent methyltransferase